MALRHRNIIRTANTNNTPENTHKPSISTKFARLNRLTGGGPPREVIHNQSTTKTARALAQKAGKNQHFSRVVWKTIHRIHSPTAVQPPPLQACTPACRGGKYLKSCFSRNSARARKPRQTGPKGQTPTPQRTKSPRRRKINFPVCNGKKFSVSRRGLSPKSLTV